MVVTKKQKRNPWPDWFEVWFNRQWEEWDAGSWDKYAAMRVAWSAYCKGKRAAR